MALASTISYGNACAYVSEVANNDFSSKYYGENKTIKPSQTKTEFDIYNHLGFDLVVPNNWSGKLERKVVSVHNFNSSRLEVFIEVSDYKDVLGWLKKKYPNLIFEFDFNLYVKNLIENKISIEYLCEDNYLTFLSKAWGVDESLDALHEEYDYYFSGVNYLILISERYRSARIFINEPLKLRYVDMYYYAKDIEFDEFLNLIKVYALNINSDSHGEN